MSNRKRRTRRERTFAFSLHWARCCASFGSYPRVLAGPPGSGPFAFVTTLAYPQACCYMSLACESRGSMCYFPDRHADNEHPPSVFANEDTIAGNFLRTLSSNCLLYSTRISSLNREQHSPMSSAFCGLVRKSIFAHLLCPLDSKQRHFLQSRGKFATP